MFAIIKFLLDFYSCNLGLQVLIIAVCFFVSILIVNKLDHISKLIISSFVAVLYYLCLVAINFIITYFIFNSTVYYISNFYLSLQLGLSFFIFALFLIVTQYLKTKNPLKLVHKIYLTIANTKIELTGFLDTGNSLKEPSSGKGVVIVKLESIKPYITQQMYADLMFGVNSSGCFLDIKKIRYSTISGTNFITVFKPAKVELNKNVIDCFIGITMQDILYDALLTPDFIV